MLRPSSSVPVDSRDRARFEGHPRFRGREFLADAGDVYVQRIIVHKGLIIPYFLEAGLC